MINYYSPTIGTQYIKINEIIEEKEISIEIWDTSGDSKYNFMKYLYYKDINLVLLIFDINNYESLMYIKNLLKN